MAKKVKKKSVKKKPASKSITHLQKRFCDVLILMEISGKVEKRRAFEMAGYKARGHTAEVEVTKTLSKPLVKAYLSRGRARIKRAVEKTEAEIIAQFEKLGFAELTDFATWDKHGVKLKSSKDVNKNKLPALKSITVDEKTYQNKKGKEGTTRRIKIELHSPRGALETLAKIKGMLKQEFLDSDGEPLPPIQVNVIKK